ncbi:hypothetical protein Hanom_Chr03g00261181 [Helianthus anomalus]
MMKSIIEYKVINSWLVCNVVSSRLAFCKLFPFNKIVVTKKSCSENKVNTDHDTVVFRLEFTDDDGFLVVDCQFHTGETGGD